MSQRLTYCRAQAWAKSVTGWSLSSSYSSPGVAWSSAAASQTRTTAQGIGCPLPVAAPGRLAAGSGSYASQPAATSECSSSPGSWPCPARPAPDRGGAPRFRASPVRSCLRPAGRFPAPVALGEPRPDAAPAAPWAWPLRRLASDTLLCWPRPGRPPTAECSPPAAGPNRRPTAPPAGCGGHRPTLCPQNASGPTAAGCRNASKSHPASY